MIEPQTTNSSRVIQSQSFMSAVDCVAVGLPSILGSVLILYSQVAPNALSAGVLAAFLGVAWVTLLTSQSSRPIAYTTRFFEAATLATLVLQIAHRLPQYGLQDTEAVRLGLLCGMSGMAGLVAGLLWLLRAERLARFIPAPVYIDSSSLQTLVSHHPIDPDTTLTSRY